jgi:SH3-like domain-containing protein
MLRKLVVAAVAVAVFLITPYVLYQRVTAFDFGEAEMRRAVEGTWTVELTTAEGARRSLTLEIEQARSAARVEREHGWIRSAAACGSRTFIRSADACMDKSEMELKLTATGDDRPASLRGRLIVVTKSFQRGQLELELDDRSLGAQISRTGDVLEVFPYGGGAARLARVRARP